MLQAFNPWGKNIFQAVIPGSRLTNSTSKLSTSTKGEKSKLEASKTGQSAELVEGPLLPPGEEDSAEQNMEVCSSTHQFNTCKNKGNYR